jgi:RND family efflux transporter MFP subunit
VDRGTRLTRGQLRARIEAAGVRGEAAGARASIAAAEASVAEAQQRLQGARELFQAGALSAVDLRGEEAKFEAAQAQLAAAQAQFAGASESARRATVEAPIDGVVSKRDVADGEAVSNGQQLFTVVNSSVIELSGQVSVQAAQRVRVGQAVQFTLDAYPREAFMGTIARIDPVADPATRRVGIAVELPNEDGRLIGGQFVTGTILAAGVEQGLLVPENAVRGATSAPFVLAVDGDRVVRRTVTVDNRPADSNFVVIASGLREGEQVIVTPATTLAEGTRVRVAGVPKAESE